MRDIETIQKEYERQEAAEAERIVTLSGIYRDRTNKEVAGLLTYNHRNSAEHRAALIVARERLATLQTLVE